jgi:putative ABC transport system ATP-binding protein
VAVIEATKISKTFLQSAVPIRALHEISISFHTGEFAIIKGPSGSGKTTLLSILGCLLSPSAGDVRIFGKRTSEMSDKERQMVRLQKIGFIFQDFNLLDALTARANVAITHQLLGHSRRKALEKACVLLQEVGLQNRLDFHIRDLSQGEKQRVAIARAFINDPEIILADEPTANLDSGTGHQVVSLLKDLSARKKTVIIATHDERILQEADRVISMNDGEIVNAMPEADILEKMAELESKL